MDNLHCHRGEIRMKKLVKNVIFSIPVCGSAWDYFKKVALGFSDGTVSFNVPLGELLAFLFFDWFWLLLLGYALIFLIPFIYKKIQHANAENRKKKELAEKQRFFSWLNEYKEITKN